MNSAAVVDNSLPDDSTGLVASGPRSSGVREGLLVGRVVVASVLVSLLWKVKFFLFASQVYAQLPLRDGFFPDWLRSATTSSAFYLGAVAALVAMMFSRRRGWLLFLSVAATVCLALLVIHQHAYNDVTFFTCVWTCLWCTWWFHRLDDEPAGRLARGAFLAHVILALILLGGGVGKLTPGYWSGTVFYEIYFSGRDYWLFNLLRTGFDEPALRQMACWYSRGVIVTELACGGLWLLPQRLASAVAVVVLLGIALASNTWLFSVVGCLLGLAMVGLHQPRTTTVPIHGEGGLQPEVGDRPAQETGPH